jgi:hypothetical protein
MLKILIVHPLGKQAGEDFRVKQGNQDQKRHTLPRGQAREKPILFPDGQRGHLYRINHVAWS